MRAGEVQCQLNWGPRFQTRGASQDQGEIKANVHKPPFSPALFERADLVSLEGQILLSKDQTSKWNLEKGWNSWVFFHHITFQGYKAATGRVSEVFPGSGPPLFNLCPSFYPSPPPRGPRSLLGPSGTLLNSLHGSKQNIYKRHKRDINRVLTRLTFHGIVCHLFHDERPHSHQEGEKQSEKRTESLIFGFAHTSTRTWAFPVAQTVKNLPAVRETWVRSLGWEDPLEEGMATHSSILAWRIPMDRGAWWAITHGVAKSWTWLSD